MKYDSPAFVDVYGHPYTFMKLTGEWARRCTCKNDEQPCDPRKWDINLPPSKLVVSPPAVGSAESPRKKWHL